MEDAKTIHSYFLGSTYLSYFWTNLGPIPVEYILKHILELLSNLFYAPYWAYLGIPIKSIKDPVLHYTLHITLYNNPVYTSVKITPILQR